jgi:hypothetical protein
LGSAQKFTRVDFAAVVIEELERKIELHPRNNRRMTNTGLASFGAHDDERGKE